MIKTDGVTAILIFDLADRSQCIDHKRCVDSEKIALAMWEIREILFSDRTSVKKLKGISEIMDTVPLDDYIE